MLSLRNIPNPHTVHLSGLHSDILHILYHLCIPSSQLESSPYQYTTVVAPPSYSSFPSSVGTTKRCPTCIVSHSRLIHAQACCFGCWGLSPSSLLARTWHSRCCWRRCGRWRISLDPNKALPYVISSALFSNRARPLSAPWHHIASMSLSARSALLLHSSSRFSRRTML
jgi:hypothetical protein